jgi:hypothetical protein
MYKGWATKISPCTAIFEDPSRHTVTPLGDFTLPAAHSLTIHNETNRSATDKFKSPDDGNPTETCTA